MVDFKRCCGCGLNKPEEEFRWKQKSKGVRVSWCRPCDKERRKKNYDPVKEKQAKERYLTRRRERIAEGLPEKPCKICPDCKKVFAIEEFRWRDQSLGVRIGRCKRCDQSWRARDYRAKSGSYRARIDSLHRELRQIVLEHKQGSCQDCGISYPPYVMDFDHRDPTQKVAKISNLMRLGSKERLLAELGKCDLVCSNCHRIRHHQRKIQRAHSDLGVRSNRAKEKPYGK